MISYDTCGISGRSGKGNGANTCALETELETLDTELFVETASQDCSFPALDIMNNNILLMFWISKLFSCLTGFTFGHIDNLYALCLHTMLYVRMYVMKI